MLKLKEKIKFYLDKDYFRVGAAGMNKVRKTNMLAFIGGGAFIIIVIFDIILNINTNYYMLHDFEDYVEEFKEGEHSSNFEKINLGIKLMPSFNLENNVLYMKQSTEVSKNKN